MTKPTAKPRKPSAQRGAAYAEGGGREMFGRGDRTKVDVPDSAGPQTPGRTSQRATSKPKFAEGGGNKMVPRQAAEPAQAGQAGKKETPPGSRHASGGLDAIGGISRPAKPGQCGT
jgi:hypothetical protein